MGPDSRKLVFKIDFRNLAFCNTFSIRMGGEGGQIDLSSFDLTVKHDA